MMLRWQLQPTWPHGQNMIDTGRNVVPDLRALSCMSAGSAIQIRSSKFRPPSGIMKDFRHAKQLNNVPIFVQISAANHVLENESTAAPENVARGEKPHDSSSNRNHGSAIQPTRCHCEERSDETISCGKAHRRFARVHE
jgi:hypothetical protein